MLTELPTLDVLQRQAEASAEPEPIWRLWYQIQEALSRQYGNGLLMILCLKAGGFAVFDSRRNLIGLCEELPPREELEALAAQASQRLSPPPPRPSGAASTNLSLEELGF